MFNKNQVNAGKEVPLSDIKDDCFFINKTMQCFMVKNVSSEFWELNESTKKYVRSTNYKPDNECMILVDGYREFSLECERERLKLIESEKRPDVDFFAEHGIDATPVAGSCWFTSKATVYKVLDGVQYIIDATDHFGEYQHDKVKDLESNFQILYSHYHEQIKEVVKYLQSNLELGHIWVLISGHTVYHQLFIGNETGYLASMWIGDKHPVKTVKCNVEWEYNNKYFTNFSTELNVKVKNAS